MLVVGERDDARTGVAQALRALGRGVTVTADRQEALARTDLAEFDLIVSDLDDVESGPDSANVAEAADIVKAFKVGVSGSRARRAIAELHDIVEKTLRFKLQRIDVRQQTHVREKI